MSGAITRPPLMMPGAEPFFAKGHGEAARIGCLCLHGVNASPDEMRWYGALLAEQGFAVYVPRLPGHGVQSNDMRRVIWQDWYYAALDGYHLLRAECDRVFVCGHSMGGLLALSLGAWQAVDGLVVMASPLDLPNLQQISRARWIKYMRPYIDGRDQSGFVERVRAEQSRRGETPRGRVRYNVWATQSIQNLYELMLTARAVLPLIHAPVLTLYSEADPTVPVANQQALIDGLTRAVVERHTYQESGHILPQDVDYHDVAARSAAFITHHAGLT